MGNERVAACAAWRAAALAGIAAALLLSASAQPQGDPGTPASGRIDAEPSATDWRIAILTSPAAELAAGDASITPGADGQFELQVPGGAPLFLCPYLDGRLAADDVVLLRAKAASALPGKFDFGPKPPRARVEFALQREDGTPLPAGTRVHLYNTYGELLGGQEARVPDERGTVSFARMPCTAYDLWLETPPGDGLVSAVFHGLVVEAGEGVQTFGLKVARGGSARGALSMAGGSAPPVGSTISVQTGTAPDEALPAEQRPADYARGALTCYSAAPVAPDGSFVLRGLDTGRHSLDVRVPPRAGASFTISGVEVKAGEETDLGEVQLPLDAWEPMINGRTLDGWRESGLYGQQEAYVADDRIVLPAGNDMTGVTWEGALQRVGYEVSLQAVRVAGSDFFCGLTFPVNDACCTLIMGGWGGSLVGLSCLNGADASENEFSTSLDFDEQRWYRIRLKVTAARITAWLDDRVVIDAPIEGRRLSTRWEVEKCEPFGFSTWRTTGALRDIRVRRLGPGN